MIFLILLMLAGFYIRLPHEVSSYANAYECMFSGASRVILEWPKLWEH